MHRQDVEEECEGSGGVSGQAAGGEAQVWFTEIADEHDALRRQILALQTQKVRQRACSANVASSDERQDPLAAQQEEHAWQGWVQP
jgi:hypothetical protein